MSRRKRITVTRVCEYCQQPFEMPLWRIKQGTPGKFCSVRCHSQAVTTDLHERFQKYVGATTASGCILWVGMTNKNGYGQINAGGKLGRLLRAHRVAYEIANGPIPDGLCVLHSCDNPPCINPDHLFLGTNVENKADCVRKERQARGEGAGKARLTIDQVREIRRLYDNNLSTQVQLAAMFGMKQPGISSICRRENWKHVH